MSRIYLDYASGAPVGKMGNPGGLHAEGLAAKKILEAARARTARVLGARLPAGRQGPREIIFTGSGTEANNLAIMGVLDPTLYPPLNKGRVGEGCIFHIVTTNIEHASVLETCKYLEKTDRAKVTYVPVESNGIVDPRKIGKALRPNTILVSVMYANNEIGTIQPIREIAKIIRHFRKNKAGKRPLAGKGRTLKMPQGPTLRSQDLEEAFPFFHTDAVQAANYLDIRPDYLGVDLMTLNSSKIYGPKGVGMLYVRAGVKLGPVLHGGDHEFGLRPGTENVPAIAGFAKALELAQGMREKESARLAKLRDYFFNEIHLTPQPPSPRKWRGGQGGRGLKVILNGDATVRLPNIINISVPGVESEMLVLELDARGIAVSSKSACKSSGEEESHVISAIRQGRTLGIKKGSTLKRSKEEGAVRISLGRATTKSDIDYLLKSLRVILSKLTRQKLWYN